MSKFDSEIDRAVREMLDVEPAADLRGRVLARIDPDSVASAFRRKDQFRRKIVWGAAPLAAAAVIILAVLAPWRQPSPPVITPAPPSIARVEPKPVVPIMEAARPASPPVQRPASRGIEERIVVAAVAPADDADAIDPLSPIAPITVAPVRPADIAPKEIAISPLTPITELQIAPLSPPDRRN
jgi:hypothetical protein